MGGQTERGGWVVALAEAEGLRWVLSHARMAWTQASARRASVVRPGDRLVLYVARGAFHNPTRDRSQLLGLAEVTSPCGGSTGPSRSPGGRSWPGATFASRWPSRSAGGVPVRELVDRLSFIRRKEVWGQYFPSGLVALPSPDLRVMEAALRRAAGPGAESRA